MMEAAALTHATARDLRALWGLEEGGTFLNHGAFGATPLQLLEKQQSLRAEAERHPTQFFMQDLQPAILEATARLADFVGAPAEQTVMVENATSGICTVLRSLRLKPGTRIVTTSHVYNAVRNALTHTAKDCAGFVLEAAVPLPVAGPNDFLDAIDSALDAQTGLVVVDHIASPTALILPVRSIVERCRARGIPVLIDGSHSAGGIDLNIAEIGADWYIGNCHKWLCAPKGAAFLVARAGAEKGLHPLAISHAYGTGFKAEFGKIGSRDCSPWLCVPDAIDFHEALGGAALRTRNRDVALSAGRLLADRLGTDLSGPPEMFGPMISVRLPELFAPTREAAAELTRRLWEEHRIDVLILPHSEALWLRVSIHAYNDMDDVEKLAATLTNIIRPAAGGAAPC